MKNRTVTITVSASLDEVFSFLSNPKRLPEWAYTFSKSVKPKEDEWEVTTPGGSTLALMVKADRSSGCIDLFAGPTLEQRERFPIRVYEAVSGKTSASFTMFKSARPGMTDDQFEAHYAQLVKEVEGLLERFGGGSISRGLPSGNRLMPGFVTSKLAETRDFYVERLGFKAVFDAPMYVHLVREQGGEQIGLMTFCEASEQPEFETQVNGAGLWLSLEVEDIDAEYERLLSEGVAFREQPKDQLWGERTAVVVDPNGVLVYLGQKTGKMDESLLQYMQDSELAVASG